MRLGGVESFDMCRKRDKCRRNVLFDEDISTSRFYLSRHQGVYGTKALASRRKLTSFAEDLFMLVFSCGLAASDGIVGTLDSWYWDLGFLTSQVPQEKTCLGSRTVGTTFMRCGVFSVAKIQE